MSTTDADRHHLRTTLEGWLGEEANVLMELLPPVDWTDIATKQDLQLVRAEVHRDISDFRAEVQRDFRESHRSLLFSMVAAMSGQTVLLLTVLLQLR